MNTKKQIIKKKNNNKLLLVVLTPKRNNKNNSNNKFANIIITLSESAGKLSCLGKFFSFLLL